jgi:hypothetical protein
MTVRWTVGLTVLLGVGICYAQETAQTPLQLQAAEGDPAAADSRAEVARRLRLLRAWEITRALRLDGEVAGKVLAVFARNDEKRQALVKQLQGSRRELQKLVRRKDPDPTLLQTQVDTLVRSQFELSQLRNSEFQELRAILSPLQQAKYLLAQQRFQKRIQEILKQVRKK